MFCCEEEMLVRRRDNLFSFIKGRGGRKFLERFLGRFLFSFSAVGKIGEWYLANRVLFVCYLYFYSCSRECTNVQKSFPSSLYPWKIWKITTRPLSFSDLFLTKLPKVPQPFRSMKVFKKIQRTLKQICILYYFSFLIYYLSSYLSIKLIVRRISVMIRREIISSYYDMDGERKGEMGRGEGWAGVGSQSDVLRDSYSSIGVNGKEICVWRIRMGDYWYVIYTCRRGCMFDFSSAS